MEAEGVAGESFGEICDAGVGGWAVIYGIDTVGLPPWDPRELPSILTPGLIGPEATAPHRSRLRRARKAASHLISSSSLGAQSTIVRLAVTIRKVWSSDAEWALSV